MIIRIVSLLCLSMLTNATLAASFIYVFEDQNSDAFFELRMDFENSFDPPDYTSSWGTTAFSLDEFLEQVDEFGNGSGELPFLFFGMSLHNTNISSTFFQSLEFGYLSIVANDPPFAVQIQGVSLFANSADLSILYPLLWEPGNNGYLFEYLDEFGPEFWGTDFELASIRPVPLPGALVLMLGALFQLAVVGRGRLEHGNSLF